MKSPLSEVKERFGDKAKLVDAVKSLATADLWLDRVSEAKGLHNVSNTKLLKLHGALTLAQKEFGTRAKLISAILKLENRSKDSGYQLRLERYPLPRLLDTHRAASRRQRQAEKQAAAAKATDKPAAKKRPRSKKAQAKAR